MGRTDLLQQTMPLVLDWVGPLILCRGEVRRVPPAVSGVYLIHLHRPGLPGYPIIYAGRSGDLRRRLTEHLSSRGATAAARALGLTGRRLFSAAPVPRDVLSEVEAGLIRRLGPALNRQLPTCSTALADLPPLWVDLNEVQHKGVER